MVRYRASVCGAGKQGARVWQIHGLLKHKDFAKPAPLVFPWQPTSVHERNALNDDLTERGCLGSRLWRVLVDGLAHAVGIAAFMLELAIGTLLALDVGVGPADLADAHPIIMAGHLFATFIREPAREPWSAKANLGPAGLPLVEVRQADLIGHLTAPFMAGE